MECIANPYIDWKNFWTKIGHWTYVRSESGHLWYVFEYVKIIICFPIMQILCKNSKYENFARRFAIGLLILSRLSDDLQHLVLGGSQLMIYTPFKEMAIAYVLIGYEFKINFYKVKERINTILLLCIYILSNLAIWFLDILDERINDTINYYHVQDSFFIIISSCALFFVLLKNINTNRFSEKVRDWVLFISDKTFYIYLIHNMIIRKIQTLGLVKLKLHFNPFIEYIMVVLTVFLFSLLVASAYAYIKNKFILYLQKN